MQPFVSGVTANGKVTLIFSDKIAENADLEESLNGKAVVKSNSSRRMRMLAASSSVEPSNKLAMYDQNIMQPEIFDEYKTFTIELSSTQTDNEPVNVNWSLIDFDGQTSNI